MKPVRSYRNQRLESLRGIHHERLRGPDGKAVSQRRWRSMMALLRQIELWSRRGPCMARVCRLAEALGRAARAIQDTSRWLQAAGLLRVVARVGSTNVWVVCWDKVEKLAKMSQPLFQCTPPRTERAHRNTSAMVNSGGSPPVCEKAAAGEKPYRRIDTDRAQVSASVRKVVGVCGKPSIEEWRFAKALGVASASGMLSENALADSLEGVRRAKPRSPYAYLRACLKRQAKRVGHELGAMLGLCYGTASAINVQLAPQTRLCEIGDREPVPV